MDINSFTYDGNAKEPNVLSVVMDKTLSSSTDYTVSYFNNVNAGPNATVTITATSTSANYTGTATKTFTIDKATPTVTASVVDGTYYIGRELSTVGIECDNPDGEIAWTTGSTVLTASGTYGWTFVPADTANWNDVTGNLPVTAVAELDSISVVGIGTYTAYDSFTTSGLTITAHYLGGVADATVAADDCTITVPYTDGNTYFIVANSGSEVAFEYAENGITVNTEVEITVIKADYDLSSVRMDDKTEPYNGQEKSITVAGTLPTGLNGGKSGLEVLHYIYNLSEATGRTNVGEYEVVAVLNNLDPDNYNTPELKAILTINKATPTVTVSVATGTYFVGDVLSNIGITVAESDAKGSVSWTDDTLTLTDGGSYKWTFVPDDTANYNNATGFASVKVSFKVVSIRVYNAITNYSAYDTFDTTGMVVEATYASGKTPTAVEGWTFSYPGSTNYFLVADDGKSMTIYYTEGGNDVTTTVEIHVVKKTVDMSEVEMENKEVTYNGSSWSITAENLPTGVEVDHYTYNGETLTKVTDSDTYTVVAVFKVTDTANVAVPADKTAQLIINRAEAEFNTTDLQTVYTYRGETITIISGVEVTNGEQTVNYSDNEFKYVSDSGNLVVSVEQSTNYNAKTLEIEITINKAELSLTWNGEEGPYDGTVHSAVLEVAGAVGEDIGVITTESFGALITVNYAGPDAERKNVGVYTPSVDAFPEASPYDNYSFVITNSGYTFAITDGVLNITFISDSVPYDGENHELFANGVPDEMQVTYYYKNTTDLFTGVTDVHYEGGEVAGYEITAKFACSTGNYTAPADMYATLTITPREIASDEVSGIESTYTYKGSSWTPAPVVALQLVDGGNTITLDKGEDYTVNYSTTAYDAGTEVTVKVKGSGNYGGEIEISFTIVKALLGLEWNEGDYVYNGAGQGVTATLTGVAEVDKDTVTLAHAYEGVGDTHYSGTDLPVNAGDYLVTVSLGELANYETFSSRSRNFKIKKADVSVAVEWEDYNEGVDELYEGSSVPTLNLNGTPHLGDIEVTGTLACQHTALIFGENEYIWIFTPQDTENFNTVYVKKILNAISAKISAIHVGWRDGTMPSIYVSTTLEQIREYLEITCDLTGRTDTITLDKSAEYTISGNWENSGDSPKFGNTTYVLTVRYNGKVDTIDAYYIALDYSLKVDKVENFKTEYKGLDEFDRASIKVTAVRNDGVEEVVTDYTIGYLSGDALWVGDTYITVIYDANGTLEKPIEREVNGIRVIPKDYDLSGIYFPESNSAEYDGTSKAYAITGTFADGEVSYTYAKRNSSGVFESCTADDLIDVGTYRITVRFTLKGEANEANYNKIAAISSELNITPADCGEIIGLVDVTVEYNDGNSLADAVRIKELPVGVTGVQYGYALNGKTVSEDEVVNAGSYVVTVSFEVDANHNAIMPRTVKLIINKVEPSVSKPVVSGSLSSGTKLSDLFFDELENGVKGTFTWDNAEQVLKEGMNRCAYTFTPDDTANYKVVKGYLDLTITGSAAPAEGNGGTNSVGLSPVVIAIMSVVTVLILIIAIAALKIAVSSRKAFGSDADGFYDDVSPDDMK